MNEKKEWGKGIPDYNDSDLMTKEQIHSFGVSYLADVLVNNGYKIYDFNPVYRSFPSIVAEKDNELFAMIAVTTVEPEVPKLKLTDKFALIGVCNKMNSTPCFVPIVIRSMDEERASKSLTLYDDDYMLNVGNIKCLSKEPPAFNTEDYCVFVMQYIGGYLRSYKFDFLKDYILEDSIIKNEITNEEIRTGIIDYLKKIFENHALVNHYIIKSVGDYKIIPSKNVEFGDNEATNIKIMQEPDKIGLLIMSDSSIFNNGDNGLILNPTFDGNGKISKITIIDPRLYGFKSFDE